VITSRRVLTELDVVLVLDMKAKGGVEVLFIVLLITAVDRGQWPASRSARLLPVFIEYEDGCAPQQFSTFQRGRKSGALTGNRSTIRQLSSL
jgi:hypothetical protein